jgi:uncharacterized phage protein gp47/JayE
MAFFRPTAAQIISRIAADIESRLEGADAKLRKTVEGVLGRALGGASHGLHGHIQHGVKQIIPSIENDEENATRWGDFWLGDDGRKEAGLAIGSIPITGVPTTPVPTDTVWQRADGVRYLVDSPGVVIGGGGDVSTPITAETPGADGNAVIGTALTIVSPIAGVDATALVEDDGAGNGLVNGTDIESIEDLIGRVELRVQDPPRGGADGDYIQEALTVAGVTRAFEFPLQLGPGTVLLTFVLDDQTPTIIPSPTKVAEVQAVIDAFRPVTAAVTVAAPAEVPLNPVIDLKVASGFTFDQVKANVTAQLEDYLLRRGGDNSTLLLSQINEAISLASGEEDHVTVSPVANVTHAIGEVPVLGTPVYGVLP